MPLIPLKGHYQPNQTKEKDMTYSEGAAEAAKSAPPWTAAIAVISGIELSQWVMIATLLYTVLQIMFTIKKLVNSGDDGGSE